MQDFKENENVVKVIRSRKARTALLKCGLWVPLVSWVSVMTIAYISKQSFMQSLSSGSLFLPTFNLCMNSRDESREKTTKVLESLSKDISKAIEVPHWRVSRLDDIFIIPKNIKVGENLDAINIVPIYKKGKFIIIKGNYSLEILAQYKEDGKTVVKILDDDEIREEYEGFNEIIKRKIPEGYVDFSGTSKRP